MIKLILTNKMFWKNVSIALLVSILIFIGLYQLLKKFTRHGQSIEVVNFKGKDAHSLFALFETLPFKYEITDSVFRPNEIRGSVLDQTPQAGTFVKEGRTIYLTINAYNAPKVKMPNFVDASLRQVEGVIESYGLKIGKISYKPDFAKDAVLFQSINGKTIAKGELIAYGSIIDLILGDGNEKITISYTPQLIGLTLKQVKTRLENMGLQLGNLNFDEMLGDTLDAYVYEQSPKSGLPTTGIGSFSLSLTFDKEKAVIQSQPENTSNEE